MDAPLTRRGGRAASVLLEATLLALLLAFSAAAVRLHQRDDSPTFDEAVHLFSGAEALEDGSGWLNPEHPPLLKLAGALALRPLRLATPCRVMPCTASPFNGYLRWLYANSAPAHRIVAEGRRPFPWILLLLAVVLHLGVRRLAGPAAGLLAAGVVALDPGFVAHAAYVHTDVGAAFAFLLVVLLAVRAASGTTLVRWLLLGVAFGLALVTKFSAVLLLPVVAVAPFLALVSTGRLRPGGPPPWRVTRDRVLGALVALAVAAGVVYAVKAFVLRRMPAEAVEASVRSYLESREARPAEVEAHVLVARLSPPLGHWLGGLKGVLVLSERGRGANWFHGETSERAFPLYFPAAFLFKSTPSFLALLLVALAAGLARLRPRAPALPPRTAIAVLLPLLVAAGYFASSMRSSFNIGARHLLPVWALLAFSAAVVVGRSLAARPRVLAGVALVLVAGTGLSLVPSRNAPIAYFNLLAGGPEGGRRWFSDSNVDWGQDLYRLHLLLAERGWEETTTVVAYGGVATNYYSRSCRLLDPAVPFGPGRYAVSHMMETLGYPFTKGIEGEAGARQVEALVRALKERGRRIAFVGGSITVWELPG